MNLYLRLILTLIRSLVKPAIKIGDTIELNLRVLPNDLDFNGHMNNGRYLTILDLALIEYMTRAGLVRLGIKNGWKPVLGASIVSYRKGLKPFATYSLRFSLVCWDAQWSYMTFEFICNGRVMAVGHNKGAIIGRKGIVPSDELYKSLGFLQNSPAIPASIGAWLEAERLMNSASA
nr:thioesterase family protein [uncultured Pseudomonas sp.]